MYSYVYFISNGNNAVKIGKSNDPAKRVKELQTGSPHTLTLIRKINHYIDKAAHDVEQQYHELLASKRLKGEWFELTDNEVHALCILESKSRIVTKEEREYTIECIKAITNKQQIELDLMEKTTKEQKQAAKEAKEQDAHAYDNIELAMPILQTMLKKYEIGEITPTHLRHYINKTGLMEGKLTIHTDRPTARLIGLYYEQESK